MKKYDEHRIKIKCFTYVGDTLVEQETEEKNLKWTNIFEDLIKKDLFENMGIGSMHSMYIETRENQDKEEEYNKILMFLQKYLENYSVKNDVPVSDLKLDFINYGKTELVYVLTCKDGQKFTLLVKQPAVICGEVYQEMMNLLELKEKDQNVVAPIDYFQLGDQELYVTPYINQARCIASDNKWGMYIPEPFYRFEPFNFEQEKIVTTCMIAKLVSFYDFDKQEGISCCKLGGGDFMLPKGWENETPTIENTLNQLYFIAARKKVKCSFEEYLQLIRNEFSRATINENQSKLIINLRGRVPMTVSSIEAGIKLGKFLVNQKEQPYVKKLEMNE